MCDGMVFSAHPGQCVDEIISAAIPSNNLMQSHSMARSDPPSSLEIACFPNGPNSSRFEQEGFVGRGRKTSQISGVCSEPIVQGLKGGSVMQSRQIPSHTP